MLILANAANIQSQWTALCFTCMLDLMISKYCTNPHGVSLRMKLWYKPSIIKLTNVTAFTALINDITKRIQTFPVYFVIYTQIPPHMFIHIYGFKLLSINLHLNLDAMQGIETFISLSTARHQSPKSSKVSSCFFRQSKILCNVFCS
jgi:hypothetical protein